MDTTLLSRINTDITDQHKAAGNNFSAEFTLTLNDSDDEIKLTPLNSSERHHTTINIKDSGSLDFPSYHNSEIQTLPSANIQTDRFGLRVSGIPRFAYAINDDGNIISIDQTTFNNNKSNENIAATFSDIEIESAWIDNSLPAEEKEKIREKLEGRGITTIEEIDPSKIESTTLSSGENKKSDSKLTYVEQEAPDGLIKKVSKSVKKMTWMERAGLVGGAIFAANIAYSLMSGGPRIDTNQNQNNPSFFGQYN